MKLARSAAKFTPHPLKLPRRIKHLNSGVKAISDVDLTIWCHGKIDNLRKFAFAVTVSTELEEIAGEAIAWAHAFAVDAALFKPTGTSATSTVVRIGICVNTDAVADDGIRWTSTFTMITDLSFVAVLITCATVIERQEAINTLAIALGEVIRTLALAVVLADMTIVTTCRRDLRRIANTDSLSCVAAVTRSALRTVTRFTIDQDTAIIGRGLALSITRLSSRFRLAAFATCRMTHRGKIFATLALATWVARLANTIAGACSAVPARWLTGAQSTLNWILTVVQGHAAVTLTCCRM